MQASWLSRALRRTLLARGMSLMVNPVDKADDALQQCGWRSAPQDPAATDRQICLSALHVGCHPLQSMSFD